MCTCVDCILGAKYTTHKPLGDAGWSSKVALLLWGVLQSGKAVTKCGLHQTVKVACSSLCCYQKCVANGVLLVNGLYTLVFVQGSRATCRGKHLCVHRSENTFGH